MIKIQTHEWLESWLAFAGREGSETDLDHTASKTNVPMVNDPTSPDLSYLKLHFAEALASFYATIEKIMANNPVDVGYLTELVGKAGAGVISQKEAADLQSLKIAAARQGRAVGGVYGFFLKYKPYVMLTEIRIKESLFQPPFGPIMVVDGDSVRDVLSRHDEFTVAPYGREMVKSMTPAENGGFDTFILSTDSAEKYVDDKKLLTTVVNKADQAKIADLVHQDCMQRAKFAVQEARKKGQMHIDIVTALARFVPVTISHSYFGIPIAKDKGRFDLTDDMLKYYGTKVAGPDGTTPLPIHHQRPDGSMVELPDTALGRADGVIPDERQFYDWIKASFQNFFNNVQKDIEVQAHGVRSYRELLVYLLYELQIQRAKLQADQSVPDTMLSRLLKLQMGIADPAMTPAPPIDPARTSDLRIVENIMGTVVGAVAGQEEATCRMIDSIIRLKEGEYAPNDEYELNPNERHGTFDEARQLALNVLNNTDVAESRRQLGQYALEALRLQPQSETLLRECTKDGAIITGSRPIRAGTLIFTAHSAAMKDIEHANAFILGRDERHYLQFGYGRHKCLGQYVAPVILVETLIAVLALENLRRPVARPDDSTFPLERRFGRLQLDDNNLYAKTFTLEFDDGGTTDQYFR